MLNPRAGPPTAAPGEGRPGVICVLLRATPAPEKGGDRAVGEGAFPEASSRALDGTLMVVLARSRPGPLSIGPEKLDEHKHETL